MSVLGLDIGGANLKAANAQGDAAVRSFEIWKSPHELESELRQIAGQFSPTSSWAVTMTAELADCFPSKAAGVEFVIEAVQNAAEGKPTRFWRTDGGWVSPAGAVQEPLKVAAANWHLQAEWAARHFGIARGLLIDVGSTTTDIIPLRDQHVHSTGLTDVERLLSSELLYNGFRRTPICAIVSELPFQDRMCPVAAEWFATTLDVYLLLGDIEPDADDLGTADGRPATIEFAHGRLARTLCCDRTEVTIEEARSAARFVADRHEQVLAEAIQRVCPVPAEDLRAVVLSGSGAVLAQRALKRVSSSQDGEIISLAKHVSPPAAEAAAAYAAACLAE